MAFCMQCGQPLGEAAQFCGSCGTALSSMAMAASPSSQASGPVRHPSLSRKIFAEKKNRWFSLALSLVIIGLGQFYNGDIKKGAVMLASALIGIPLWPPLWFVLCAWTAVDAYRVAAGKTPLWK